MKGENTLSHNMGYVNYERRPQDVGLGHFDAVDNFNLKIIKNGKNVKVQEN